MPIYDPNTCCSFRKTRDEYGAFSNMAGGYPITYLHITARTSEAFYQALRFPDHADVRAAILAEKSPMAAKFVAKANVSKTRPDWDDVRIPLMYWALRLKLIQHQETFGALLLSTGDRDIVEDIGGRSDIFWGAKLENGMFVGENMLGQLLMVLRSALLNGGVDGEPPKEVPGIVL
jgi:ribA/ribD-fused uncharacterized protein